MAKPFKIVLADPPWEFNNKGAAQAPYKTLNQDTLCALPVADVCAPDSVLFLWGCWPMLPEALQVIKAWGFEYKTAAFIWVKARKNFNNKQQSFFPYESLEKDSFFGCGNYTRANSEPLFMATRGKNPKVKNKSVRQIIFEPLTKHSKKPLEAGARIVKLLGDLPRLELFARRPCAGWMTIGNEITGRDIKEDLLLIKENLSL